MWRRACWGWWSWLACLFYSASKTTGPNTLHSANTPLGSFANTSGTSVLAEEALGAQGRRVSLGPQTATHSHPGPGARQHAPVQHQA
ncbi:hypothetical protein BDY21DRAFT_352640 [Lineolata rhizophorae]|uniref:Secreted protein n=1 Tax=Lineolata rhizophorae TaxID=578093 RepID=A0A6A6NTJ1_9PEZI|nr:hypothetical protein BDY21DRAFT_352640 [Lineolata rhizophorae]